MKETKNKMNREAWLTAVVVMAEAMFKAAELEYPEAWRVSCGFPSKGGAGSNRKTVGECHYEMNSGDGFREMFVSPYLGTSVDAIKTLLHEVVHACLGPGKGHRAEFSQACKRLGFEGKPTQAVPSDEVWGPFFEAAVAKLGEYPHATSNTAGRKKQATRMIKVACPCGCSARMTRKWLEEVGPPVCGCGEQMEIEL